MMGVGWIEAANALSLPMGATGLLILGVVSFIRALPSLRRVRMESDTSLRHALDDGAQKHIDRLEKHIERQDKRLRDIEERMEECERERAQMRGEIAELRAMLAARGEIRQRAQLIVAADRLEERERAK